MFRLMAEEMTEKEIRICMSVLFDGTIVQRVERDKAENFIRVIFSQMGDLEGREYVVDLLPDVIENLSEGIQQKQDGLYTYQQFMVAKGYSEYWKDNIFVE